MQKAKMIEKLAAVKELAERGIGGEKETALRMYADLKEKYGITDAEVAAAGPQTTQEAQRELSGITFALWVIENNLAEEMAICAECPLKSGKTCSGKEDCPTYQNRTDLEMQYEEIKAQFERGCAG